MRRASRVALYGGTAALVAGLWWLHAALIAVPGYAYLGGDRLLWTSLYVVILCVAAYGFGLPDLPRSPRSALFSSVGAAVTGAIGISLVQLALGDALLPRFVIFGAAILAVPWFVACTAFATGGSPPARDRVVLVSDDLSAPTLRRELQHDPERAASVVAAYAVDEVVGADDGDRPLVEAVRSVRANVVVLDRDAQAAPAIVAQAAVLHAGGCRVRTVSLFYEQWLGKLPLSELEQVSLLFDIGEVHRARYGRLKRLVDLVFGVLAAVAFVLAVPFVVVGNLFANRGSLLFHQVRVGKQGETFRIVKFRTMTPGTHGEEGEWTAEGDPRITPFGRFLRRTHVDELPQALNMLRGDLSMVGPRPEQPHYVEQLTAKLPFYELRHLVRPGLTGWAQVKYHYGADEHDAMEKLQYEFFYLRHQSLALDLRIIGRTLRSVLGGGGR